MSENEFLGRHNKTAYYITNLIHLQKSSPRREKKMDLAFRELNAATEKYPIRCPQKHSHRYLKRLLVYTRGYNSLCSSTNVLYVCVYTLFHVHTFNRTKNFPLFPKPNKQHYCKGNTSIAKGFINLCVSQDWSNTRWSCLKWARDAVQTKWRKEVGDDREKED